MKAPLSTRAGELTGAVFGFARKLFSILREYKPDHVGVAFDLGDTWRHQEFAEYKGTRDSMPDDLRAQIGRIEEMLRAFNPALEQMKKDSTPQTAQNDSRAPIVPGGQTL